MGLIYIATNIYMPGLMKIGRTASSSIDQRLKELSSHSSIPTPFSIEYQSETPYYHFAELEIHARLHSHRVELLREFFWIELDRAINVCKETIEIFNKNLKYFEENYPRFDLKWDIDEKRRITEAFEKDINIENLSRQFGRTPYEIEVFLNHLGLTNTTSFPKFNSTI